MTILKIFEGAQGFYWRLVAKNGKIVADGSEPYATRSNARRAAKRAKVLMAQAVIR